MEPEETTDAVPVDAPATDTPATDDMMSDEPAVMPSEGDEEPAGEASASPTSDLLGDSTTE